MASMSVWSRLRAELGDKEAHRIRALYDDLDFATQSLIRGGRNMRQYSSDGDWRSVSGSLKELYERFMILERSLDRSGFQQPGSLTLVLEHLGLVFQSVGVRHSGFDWTLDYEMYASRSVEDLRALVDECASAVSRLRQFFYHEYESLPQQPAQTDTARPLLETARVLIPPISLRDEAQSDFQKRAPAPSVSAFIQDLVDEIKGLRLEIIELKASHERQDTPPPQEFDPILERLRAAQRLGQEGPTPSALSAGASDILAPPYALSDVGARDELGMRHASPNDSVEQKPADDDGDVGLRRLIDEEIRANTIEGSRRSSSTEYRMLVKNLPRGTISRSVREFIREGANIDNTRFKIEKTGEGRFNAIFENVDDLDAAVERLNGRRCKTTTVNCYQESFPRGT